MLILEPMILLHWLNGRRSPILFPFCLLVAPLMCVLWCWLSTKLPIALPVLSTLLLLPLLFRRDFFGFAIICMDRYWSTFVRNDMMPAMIHISMSFESLSNPSGCSNLCCIKFVSFRIISYLIFTMALQLYRLVNVSLVW